MNKNKVLQQIPSTAVAILPYSKYNERVCESQNVVFYLLLDQKAEKRKSEVTTSLFYMVFISAAFLFSPKSAGSVMYILVLYWMQILEKFILSAYDTILMTLHNIIQGVIPCTLIGFWNFYAVQVASMKNILSHLNFKNKLCLL
jgi:hypothetical protein